MEPQYPSSFRLGAAEGGVRTCASRERDEPADAILPDQRVRQRTGEARSAAGRDLDEQRGCGHAGDPSKPPGEMEATGVEVRRLPIRPAKRVGGQLLPRQQL